MKGSTVRACLFAENTGLRMEVMAVVRTNAALTDTQRERERQRVEGWRKSESQTWKL